MDAAQSGASLRRADIQRLLGEAKSGKRCRFRKLLVDDLSRLSRDLGDTWQIVFGDLASAGIQLVDCTTGMSSDGAGTRRSQSLTRRTLAHPRAVPRIEEAEAEVVRRIFRRAAASSFTRCATLSETLAQKLRQEEKTAGGAGGPGACGAGEEVGP